MPLSAAARIQANSGTVTGTGFTATLPSPTTAGSTLMLWFGNTGATSTTIPSLDPPWYIDINTLNHVSAIRRPDQPAGETSWSVSASVSANFAWRIEEWAGWSTVSNPDAVPAPSNTYFINNAVQNNLTVGGSGQAITPDVSDFAGLAIWRAGGGTAIWPLRTYSSGWSEVDVLSFGTGANTNDSMWVFAEAYPGVSGAIDAELIWDTSNGGTYTDKTVDGWAGCYGPAVPVPGGVVLSA